MQLIIIIALLAIFVVFGVGIYNRLIRLRNNRENAFADIDVQLNLRHDLIPQLVDSVKGYINHEASVLTNITKARSNAINATGVNQKMAAEKELSSALKGLNISIEAYPDLKANQNMAQLQEELSSTENRIAFSRQAFMDAVMAYNIAREKFPANLIAGMFNFTEAQLLEATESAEERKAPKVTF